MRQMERERATRERNSATERLAGGMTSDIQAAYSNPFSMFSIFRRRNS